MYVNRLGKKKKRLSCITKFTQNNMRFRCPRHLSEEILLYTSKDVWPMTVTSSAGSYQTLTDIIHTTCTKTVVFSLNTMMLGSVLQCMYPHSTAWNQNTFWCSSLYSFLHRHMQPLLLPSANPQLYASAPFRGCAILLENCISTAVLTFATFTQNWMCEFCIFYGQITNIPSKKCSYFQLTAYSIHKFPY